MSQFNIIVNGEERSVEAPAEMPLLWVLRDLIALRGTKFGCGQGLCGSCTVHVNGAAMRSCITPVSAVADQEVTTIEGLSTDGSHPLQLAWDELNVSQCGYCQAGQIMNAAAWLKENPRPTMEDIDSHQGGNLCRCGTYSRIKSAIMRAAEIGRI